jgi:hypothetical protein
MKKDGDLRKWHVFFINCDCASYHDVRKKMPSLNQYMRCKYCKKQLGDMQVYFKATIEAISDTEAIEKAKAMKNEDISS